MSNKHNNSGNGKPEQKTSQPQTQAEPQATQAPAQPNPSEVQFREETRQAMEGDLMTVGQLAPEGVVAPLPTPRAIPLKIEDEPLHGAAPANHEASKAKGELAPGSSQILEMLAAGKIDADQAERLLCALKNVAPAAPKALPYLGGADGPATREEVFAAVQEQYGPELSARTRDRAELLEVMGAMVEKIVRGLREPSEEEKALLERKRQSRAQLIREQFDMIQQQRDIKDMCPHERATADGKSHTCITALHNYADNILRGICGVCQDIMEPGHESYKQVIMSHNLAVSTAA